MLKALKKDKTAMLLLFAIAAVYIGVLYTDAAPGRSHNAVKYLADTACFLLVAETWFHAYSKRDISFVLLAFAIMLAADALFLFAGQRDLGIAVFCFAHLVFIRRYNGKGLTPALMVLIGVLAICAVGWALGSVMPYTYILGATYAGLILLDAYYGFNCGLPKKNRMLVRAGMAFFLVTDASNAVVFLAPVNGAGAIAGYMVWACYIPALALLALSAREYGAEYAGYRLEKAHGK